MLKARVRVTVVLHDVQLSSYNFHNQHAKVFANVFVENINVASHVQV